MTLGTSIGSSSMLFGSTSSMIDNSTLADGILVSDWLLVSDGILVGDTAMSLSDRTMSAGDNTTSMH